MAAKLVRLKSQILIRIIEVFLFTHLMHLFFKQVLLDLDLTDNNFNCQSLWNIFYDHNRNKLLVKIDSNIFNHLCITRADGWHRQKRDLRTSYLDKKLLFNILVDNKGNIERVNMVDWLMWHNVNNLWNSV